MTDRIKGSDNTALSARVSQLEREADEAAKRLDNAFKARRRLANRAAELANKVDTLKAGQAELTKLMNDFRAELASLKAVTTARDESLAARLSALEASANERAEPEPPGRNPMIERAMYEHGRDDERAEVVRYLLQVGWRATAEAIKRGCHVKGGDHE